MPLFRVWVRLFRLFSLSFSHVRGAEERGPRSEERGAGGSASLCVHCDLSIRGHLGEKFFYKGSS